MDILPVVVRRSFCSSDLTRGGSMTKTLVDVDEGLLEKAAVIAGTITKKDTINVALREMIGRHERAEGIAWLRESGALADLNDPEVIRSARR
jgi:Arc/MetJ family transcription regulator